MKVRCLPFPVAFRRLSGLRIKSIFGLVIVVSATTFLILGTGPFFSSSSSQQLIHHRDRQNERFHFAVEAYSAGHPASRKERGDPFLLQLDRDMTSALFKELQKVQNTSLKGGLTSKNVLGDSGGSFKTKTGLTIRYLISEANFCIHTTQKVIIYVHSAPNNLKSRNAIRNTWGNPRWYDVLKHKVIFFVGNPIKQDVVSSLLTESATYHDLIIADFKDSYKNLSYKALTAIHWISTYCQTPEYVVKTDDDVFVNIFSLAHFLKYTNLEQATLGASRNSAVNSTENLSFPDTKIPQESIQCLVWSTMSVVRDVKSKWYVTNEEYRPKIYPPYCSGIGFIMRSTTAKRLYDAGIGVPFLWVDDVYLTGILRKAAGLVLVKRNSLCELNAGRFLESLVRGNKVFMHQPSHNPTLRSEMWEIIAKKESTLRETADYPFTTRSGTKNHTTVKQGTS